MCFTETLFLSPYLVKGRRESPRQLPLSSHSESFIILHFNRLLVSNLVVFSSSITSTR